MLPDTGMTKDKPNRDRDQTPEEEGQGQTGQKRGGREAERKGVHNRRRRRVRPRMDDAFMTSQRTSLLHSLTNEDFPVNFREKPHLKVWGRWSTPHDQLPKKSLPPPSTTTGPICIIQVSVRICNLNHPDVHHLVSRGNE